MPTQYTTSLGLALPVTGELSGTWGDVVNDYLTKYVDASVAGAQIISGSQTAVTLSTTNGTALSQAGSGSTGSAQYMIINCTGNPASLLTITAPATSKAYIVINATSTSQSVKIVGTGPTTGVTIPSGQRALVAWNGSDFVQVGASAGGSNTQVQFNSGGALAGSANLTFNGTTLTANTLNLTNALGAAYGGTGLTSPGTAGNVLTSNGSVWTSAAVPPGGLTYVVKSANYTASDKEGVLTNTSGGAFTVTLPATPATGAQVVVADSAGTWGTNNLTVGRNGSTIGGLAQDLVCDIAGASVQLVYDGTTWDVFAQIGGNGGTAVTLNGVQTLTNKTIAFGSNTLSDVASLSTAQTFTGTKTFAGTSSALATILNDAAEVATISATAATGTINYDVTTQSVLFYTSNASANWTVNLRGSSGTSMNSLMSTGQSVTVAFLVTQGATAYYNTTVQVDGTTSGVTTRWQGGTAPAAGNASGVDVYVYTVIKTGSATFSVFASQTRFA